MWVLLFLVHEINYDQTMKNSEITVTKIAVIGCGNMGRSLIGGLIASGVPAKHISGADISTEQCEIAAAQFNIEVLPDSQQVAKDADVVILAVKPQFAEAALQSIRTILAQSKPMIISVAAGIKLAHLNSWSGDDIPVIRAMPNTPALIQAGSTALVANQCASSAQRDLAEMIMHSVGLVLWLDDESLMDVVTALSGSGPAYYFLIMEVMEKVAVNLGLPEDQARQLTLQTAFGAASMAMESNHHAEALRKQVTSPGGATEQALNVLMKGNIEQLFEDALEAARKRAAELGDQ